MQKNFSQAERRFEHYQRCLLYKGSALYNLAPLKMKECLPKVQLASKSDILLLVAVPGFKVVMYFAKSSEVSKTVVRS